MGFKKGKSGNPSGRPVGTTNKINQNVKDMLQSIYDGNLANIQDDLDNMSPKDKWATLNKMSDKFLPSLKAIDNKVEVQGSDSLGFSIGYSDDKDKLDGEVEKE